MHTVVLMRFFRCIRVQSVGVLILYTSTIWYRTYYHLILVLDHLDQHSILLKPPTRIIFLSNTGTYRYCGRTRLSIWPVIQILGNTPPTLILR